LVSTLAQTLSDVMTREALRVEVKTADVLREPARPIVYLFLVDASLAIAFGDPIVTWAAARCTRDRARRRLPPRERAQPKRPVM
jgi:hypothetical protein